MKSCHGLRAFHRYPIIVAVNILSGIHIVLHDAEVSKISEEKLECFTWSSESASKMGRFLPMMSERESISELNFVTCKVELAS